MSEIIIIAAVAENNVIGRGLDIPWYIKDDFRHFKNLTSGHTVIMGDRTYESLPVKPLPDRENIVLTYDKNYSPENVIVMYSLEEALDSCKEKEKVFIIGGASVYEQSLKYADTLELTRIHKSFDGDVFFPEINFNDWDLIKKTDKSDEKYGTYSFLTYKRK